MQISRSWLVACAAACATTLAVRGNDTPAQIKAREALRQKLQETPAQTAPSNAPTASSDAPTAPSNVPAKPAPKADSDAIAKAREALHQQLQQPAPAPVPAP
ncbi:MAG TPA: hypothetical protein VL793_12450, partial [Patescibacteria group bacterium]|nr:hypothetical protein [Patescibacteria group bacterium]